MFKKAKLYIGVAIMVKKQTRSGGLLWQRETIHEPLIYSYRMEVVEYNSTSSWREWLCLAGVYASSKEKPCVLS